MENIRKLFEVPQTELFDFDREVFKGHDLRRHDIVAVFVMLNFFFSRDDLRD
jgi:hypothetical protein